MEIFKRALVPLRAAERAAREAREEMEARLKEAEEIVEQSNLSRKRPKQAAGASAGSSSATPARYWDSWPDVQAWSRMEACYLPVLQEIKIERNGKVCSNEIC